MNLKAKVSVIMFQKVFNWKKSSRHITIKKIAHMIKVCTSLYVSIIADTDFWSCLPYLCNAKHMILGYYFSDKKMWSLFLLGFLEFGNEYIIYMYTTSVFPWVVNVSNDTFMIFFSLCICVIIKEINLTLLFIFNSEHFFILTRSTTLNLMLISLMLKKLNYYYIELIYLKHLVRKIKLILFNDLHDVSSWNKLLSVNTFLFEWP